MELPDLWGLRNSISPSLFAKERKYPEDLMMNTSLLWTKHGERGRERERMKMGDQIFPKKAWIVGYWNSKNSLGEVGEGREGAYRLWFLFFRFLTATTATSTATTKRPFAVFAFVSFWFTFLVEWQSTSLQGQGVISYSRIMMFPFQLSIQ